MSWSGGQQRAPAAGDTVDAVRAQIDSFVRRELHHALAVRIRVRVDTAVPERTVPGRDGPHSPRRAAVAQATVTLAGHRIRAQVVSADVESIGDLLCARLAVQAARLDTPWSPRRWPPPIGQDSHFDCVLDTPSRYSRPDPGTPLGRRKLCRLTRCTVERAALTMDLMDYDIHLFVDAETGQDSVVSRVGPTGYRLTRSSSMALPTASRFPVTVSPYPVQRCVVERVIGSLTRTEMPFQFFINTDTGRGNVVYRRFGGNYGLIAPVDAATDELDSRVAE